MTQPEIRDPLALKKAVLKGIIHFASTEIRNEGLIPFLHTISETVKAKEPRFMPNRTLAEELDQRASRYGGRIFLDFEGERYSYQDLNDHASRVAQALLDMGTNVSKMVGLFLPNVPAFLEIFFAAQRIGACVIPINTSLRDEGLAYIINNAKVDTIFTSPALLPELQRVQAKLKKSIEIVIVPEFSSDQELQTGHPYRTLLASKPQQTPLSGIESSAPSMLMYTSGTTGHPKGVVYQYGHSQAKLVRLLNHLILKEDDVYYTCLPLFHANALIITTFQSMFANSRVVLSRKFSARNFWKEIRESEATIFNTLGTMIAILMKQTPDALDGKHKVRKVLSAACPAHLWQPFEERFNVEIWEAFAAVDGGGFSTFNFGNAPVGSVGKPMGRKRYRLIDDAGNDVPVNTPGELIHYVGEQSHAQVAYFENEEATKKKVRDGWVYSGDLLSKDKAGFLYFEGRKTDSMRCKGENISALELESVIDRHPSVVESTAFGVPSALGEEEVMVILVLKPGEKLTPEQLLKDLEGKLPRYAMPTYVRMLKELPKTETHRVVKHLLKAEGVTADTWTAPDTRQCVES
ncbi:AMP-binding protein [Deltaproteobacteria bacterium TL4]